MNTRQSLRLIAAAAAAANGGKQLHLNGNGSYDSDKGKYMYKGLHIRVYYFVGNRYRKLNSFVCAFFYVNKHYYFVDTDTRHFC